MNMCLFAATMRIVVIYWIVCLSTFRNADIQNSLVCECVFACESVCVRAFFYVGCISDL